MTFPPVQDIFEWDVVNWSKALPLWKKELIPGRRTALTLAEGKGGLSLIPLTCGYTLTCTDLEGVSDAARKLYTKYGYTDIHYTSADVLKLPFDADRFDAVFFKSMLGTLRTPENQQLAFKEMHRVLKPGGKLFFSENLVASSLHLMLRRKFIPWGSYWRYMSVGEIKEFTSCFSRFNYTTSGVIGAFGRNRFQRNMLGYVDTLLEHIVPAESRFILHGVCTK